MSHLLQFVHHWMWDCVGLGKHDMDFGQHGSSIRVDGVGNQGESICILWTVKLSGMKVSVVGEDLSGKAMTPTLKTDPKGGSIW